MVIDFLHHRILGCLTYWITYPTASHENAKSGIHINLFRANILAGSHLKCDWCLGNLLKIELVICRFCLFWGLSSKGSCGWIPFACMKKHIHWDRIRETQLFFEGNDRNRTLTVQISSSDLKWKNESNL